jgi:putative intracellular protease/amidase
MRRLVLALVSMFMVFALPLAHPLSAQEAQAAADALVLPAPKPGHARPLVVVIADGAGAETTDFIIPYAVLRESGAADVRSVATTPGPLQLMMALRVQPDQTIAQFDVEAPEGADIVIVPAQMQPQSPALVRWVRAQAARGATIVSICEGARVLAHAGLLHGKRATSHFGSLRDLERDYPDTTWVRNQRYVQDGQIISTTGVSASIPVSLALVESIGGREIAETVAQRLGASGWSAAHRTDDFNVTFGDYATGFGAFAAFWSHETLEAPIADGVDEVALALRADAWGRSMRTKIVTTRAGMEVTRGRNGLLIVPDAAPGLDGRLMPRTSGPPIEQLEETFAEMHRRYGGGAERLARLGMEYDRRGSMRANAN